MQIGTNVRENKYIDMETNSTLTLIFLVTSLVPQPPFSPQEYHLPRINTKYIQNQVLFSLGNEL